MWQSSDVTGNNVACIHMGGGVGGGRGDFQRGKVTRNAAEQEQPTVVQDAVYQ